MNRIWTFLLNPRVLGVIGLAALAAFLFLGATAMQVALVWSGVLLALFLFVSLVVWGVRKIRARQASQALEQAIETAPTAGDSEAAARVAALRERLVQAVKTVKKSKLGQLSGSAALYELPWYMVIGNPAAGKSTAIVRSGLKFPFADGGEAVLRGIGGTRNCDWFFTTEGILLDTAGRYAVEEEDRHEWLGFLSLLKKHRAKAPINGLLIAVSLGELGSGRPDAAIQLARQLRRRMQELTEHLEVIAPVYLVFTKADLIGGFAEFFEDCDAVERDRVWGATLPYEQAQRSDAVASFDRHFDELYEGLKQLGLARMATERGRPLAPGVLTFPLEFADRKQALRAFVATLFEENPYQYQPVFRGFYFTSSIQEGMASTRASERVAQQFALQRRTDVTGPQLAAENSYFLKDLFSKVIFADKSLVQQHSNRSRQRLRLAGFAAAVAMLALVLGAWTWSYVGNRQLVANVRADLEKAVRLQADDPDLASRISALDLLQDRIEQLERHREDRPLGISFGLYQGDKILGSLRKEYFNGVRQVMLEPAAAAIEAYLSEVVSNPARLKPMGRPPESGATQAMSGTGASRYVDASVEDAGDAYNALKTYLMLSDGERRVSDGDRLRDKREPVHLAQQVTRFWRGWLDANRGNMPRERMIASAERMISFTTANMHHSGFPAIATKQLLVDQTRDVLRERHRGLKGVERVYEDVKRRAATRFAPMTVARIVTDADKSVVEGSYAIPGTFTREAWDEYISTAFKKAATQDLQSTDWVLNTRAGDDLTLEGSPEQIQKQLTALYKNEYVREWQRFMRGISIPEFGSFDAAVDAMNRLGDPQASPIRTVLATLFDQTSWDNPSLINERLGKAQKGVTDWFKQTLMRQSPQRVEVKVDVSGPNAQVPMGPIGREFAVLSRIMMSRDSAAPPINAYLQSLSKVRTRFNQIKNQGDPGPGARALLAATFENQNSELVEALKVVDEQLLLGLSDSARGALRPLLVRPLMQALAVVVPPAETEVNRVWEAQVHGLFARTLATRYPFDVKSTIEAGPQDIAKIFGPDGAVAKFANETLSTLVVRRGDTVEPRQWAEIGLRLRPEFQAGFANWVAQLDAASTGGAAPTGGSGGGQPPPAAPDQTVFEVLPQGAPGLTEYTLVIDGQTLRYRNDAPDWMSMAWPNPAGAAGVRLAGVTHDGKTIEFFNEVGRAGMSRFMEMADTRKVDSRIRELTWTAGPYKVALHMRVLRRPGEPMPGGGTGADKTRDPPIGVSRLQGAKLPALVAGVDTTVATVPSAASAPPKAATR